MCACEAAWDGRSQDSVGTHRVLFRRRRAARGLSGGLPVLGMTVSPGLEK